MQVVDGRGAGGRAGKTSLLCALAGKVYYGTVTGRVFVNGCLDRLDRYKRVHDRPLPHHAGTTSAAACLCKLRWTSRVSQLDSHVVGSGGHAGKSGKSALSEGIMVVRPKLFAPSDN